MKNNYHTHTFRCKHASGSDEDYVLSAIRGNIKELGFSDHAPWQYNNERFVSSIRMDLSEFDDYYRSINDLKEKYKDDISIKIGLEVEYFPRYMNWMQGFIKEKKLDYIIFGNHFMDTDEYGPYYGMDCWNDIYLQRYAEDCIEGMKLGIYSYLAHPDLFMRSRSELGTMGKEATYMICKAAKELDIPLEYNLAGLQASEIYSRLYKESEYDQSDDYAMPGGYPFDEFWQLAATNGNKAIIGFDAHTPEALEVDHYYKKAVNNLGNLGIQVVDTIDFDRF